MRPIAVLAMLFVVACSGQGPATEPGAPTPPIVTAEWLKANLDNVVVIDTQSKRELYEKGHIKGARHLVVTTLRNEDKNLASVEVLERKFGDLGIRGDTHVVAYDEKNGRNATYLWYALTQLGHTRVSVLDGNLDGFRDELVSGPPPNVASEVYKAFAEPRNVVTTDWVLANLDDVYLLDTRPIEQYTGEKPKKGYRTGHVPGSHHFHRSVFHKPDGTFATDEEAKALTEKLPRDKPIVIYCNTYHDGANLHFHLTRAGFTNIRAWDGGLKEYMADESRPLNTGSEP